jgi:putative membrane protein
MMWGGYMWLFWFIVVIGIVVLVAWIIRQSRPSESNKIEGALEILKKRYAKGEIGKEEFEQKKKDLLT